MKNVYLVITLLSALTLSACGPQSRSSGMKTMTADPKSKLSQQLADQAAQPTLDVRCELSELETQMLTNSQIPDTEKKKVIDVVLVTLRGAACEKIVSLLKDEFKDSALFEQVNTRSAQMNTLDSKKVLDILIDNKKVTFDGFDLWSAATEISATTDANQVIIKGKIITGNKAASISTTVPANKIKEVKTVTAKEAAEAARGQAYSFDKDEFKSIGQGTAAKAAEELGEIKQLVTSQLKETAALPKPKISKFTFDQTDRNYLEVCGVEGIRQEIHKKMIGSTTEITITALVDQKAEKILTDSITKTLDQQRLESSISNNVHQKVESQGYWIFSEDSKRAVEISTMTRQKPTDFAEQKMLIYTMFSRQYDLTKDDVSKVTLQGAVSYQVKNLAGMSSKFSIKLDPTSAFWLTSQTDNVAKCMEDKKFAAIGASRDSIRTYILYSVVENAFRKEVSELNPPTQR